ncbi:FHA domain-containing protein [Candidatus Uabimicrobium sp. HlEnr_7]|uniref:FHA domain-containing protein n=1 Tax=Candidatus Uabimicrobium helgolandensis TaxID=3095367 RepID=UPI003558133D
MKIGKLKVIQGEGEGLSCTINDGDEASIGRNLECSIPIPDIKMSRIHCIVRNVGGAFEVLDNNSQNGTCVNGKTITFRYDLKIGDIIQIGDTKIEFSYE